MLLHRPVQTRSRSGSVAERLSLATLKQLVGSLCKRHAVTRLPGLPPLVGERFQVLFHSPVRGASHLSLTVLVHYRSSAVFSLAGWSPQIRTGFHVPRPTQVSPRSIARCPYGSFTLCAAVFQTASGSCYRYLLVILQPRNVRKHSGLGSSLFARHYWGNRLFLSFPPGTKMFQFPGFAPSLRWYWIFNPVGCPIRIRPDQFVFANPRLFSQLTASFVACRSQGILHSPLLLFSRESTFL